MQGRVLTAVAVAAVLLAAASPARATGGGDDRPVHIGVMGTGLKVREVRALLDGHEAGAKARVSLWQHGAWVREVRGWKYSDAREVGSYKFEYVPWKMNRSFPDRTKLCVEFAGHADRLACVTIHR